MAFVSFGKTFRQEGNLLLNNLRNKQTITKLAV
jgi:hypothetical protein